MQGFRVLGLFFLLVAVGHAQQRQAIVENGKTVEFEYTLTLQDGSVAQSNIGREPLAYLHGANQILPALERELLGLTVNDERRIELSAEAAYGEIDADVFEEVAIDRIPEASRQVGEELRAEGFSGPIRVDEVREETVVLDFNHPLAGQALIFNIKVVSIE